MHTPYRLRISISVRADCVLHSAWRFNFGAAFLASDFGALVVLGSLYGFLLRIPHLQGSDALLLVCRSA